MPRRDQAKLCTAYGFALGPVTFTPAPGEPAPSAPLARLIVPLNCALQQTGNPAEDGAPVDVLLAGLAPGMFGVYQMDLRIPAVSTPKVRFEAHVRATFILSPGCRG